MSSEENRVAIKRISDDLGIPPEVVIDNIITDFRARRAANYMEGVGEILAAFTKTVEDGKELVLSGIELYDFLVTTYRSKIQQDADSFDELRRALLNCQEQIPKDRIDDELARMKRESEELHERRRRRE